MTNDDSRNWMWSEALQMLARAERLHREVFTPAQGAQPAAPTPGMRTLYQNMLMLKLDVPQHVPTHGRVGTNDEFMKMFAKADKAN